MLLTVISVGVFAFRRHRYLVAAGSGIWDDGSGHRMVQISYYVNADRYTYLPQIGLYILAAWATAELCSSWRHGRLV